MTDDQRREDLLEHQAISALIPWYVNATIAEHDRARLTAHVSACEGCRDELAHELSVFRGMTADTSVEYMPSASLQRLQSRLDGVDGLESATAKSIAVSAPLRRSMPWQGLMAASIGIMAVVLGLLAADRWVRFPGRAYAASYYTVTTPVSRMRGEVIRAVFSPTITLVQLQRILDESELKIVSGPTEAGVYSLAMTSRRPVRASLALLRAHSEVRFAESAPPAGEAANPP